MVARRKGRAVKRRLWTRADMKTLRALAGVQSLKRIAKELKRTPAAVRRKATDKGISLRRKKNKK